MLRRILPSVALAGLLLATAASSALATGVAIIQAGGTCSGAGDVQFQWSYYESSGPVEYPEWIGYDVYRSSVTDCSAPVRLNAEPFARQAPPVTYVLNDTPPDPNKSWRYEVRMVDAARNQVYVLPCDCSRNAYVSCPAVSGPPITQGTLLDWGWTLAIQPCLQGCWPAAYLVNPYPPELQALVGTGQAVRIWGDMGCGSLEGCYVQVAHWETATCDIVPVVRSSWGRVKVVYR